MRIPTRSEKGVKEVWHRMKHLGWGTDTYLYRMRLNSGWFPLVNGRSGVQSNRGNAGQGVWKSNA